ncbi:Protein QDPR-1 [Aphelenchoides avenae]|nr:Protein QDPR-1 [Aphelenchus avenae]
MSAGRVLVYGGKGALGTCVLKHFKTKNFWALNVDLVPSEDADANVVVGACAQWVEQEAHVLQEVGTAVGEDGKLDAVLCVAGGWAGGNVASKDFIKNCDTVWKQSVWSSAIAARIASKHLKPGGLLQLTGAHAALHATPSMIGYGAAKASVHQMVKSLAAPKSGLPDGASVLAIAPMMLDTPQNRKWMPNADHSKWTPLEFVAEQLHHWTVERDNRPKSGCIVSLKTESGETHLSTYQ